jgi:hypothetical protein
MATAPELELTDTDGFVVESPAGDVGSVEDVWLDQHGVPYGLAVRSHEGRHGLLLRSEILAVDHDYRWVVVGPEAKVLELQRPRLAEEPDAPGASLAARWETTGELMPAPARQLPFGGVATRLSRAVTGRLRIRRNVPPAYAVALFLVALVVIVATTIALVFLAADIIAGEPY